MDKYVAEIEDVIYRLGKYCPELTTKSIRDIKWTYSQAMDVIDTVIKSRAMVEGTYSAKFEYVARHNEDVFTTTFSSRAGTSHICFRFDVFKEGDTVNDDGLWNGYIEISIIDWSTIGE